MELSLNLSYADGYKSRSQIARVITETWVSQNAYCPHCGCGTLVKDVNNSPVLDFHCPICKQGFELKSKSGKYGRKNVDGEYSTMISRITSSTNPDFFFLNYQLDTNRVTDFLLIPKQFITESIIEKRQPLSASARRAGWTGCNILVERIPTDGRIFIVKDSVVCQKDDVLSKLRETEFLTRIDSNKRGWIVDIMRCIDTLDNDEFRLSELYEFEEELQSLHPNNHHVQAKIRQQLQFLRDMGYVEFCGRGYYRRRR